MVIIFHMALNSGIILLHLTETMDKTHSSPLWANDIVYIS